MTDPEDPTPDPTPNPDEPLGDAGLRALESERRARRVAEKRLQDADVRLAALQRDAIERIAGQPADGHKPLADPSDLWSGGADVAQLLDEDGSIDPVKVRDAVRRVIESKPHWAQQPARVQGSADAGRGTAAQPNVEDLAARIIRGR
jgi:hypothetical protein